VVVFNFLLKIDSFFFPTGTLLLFNVVVYKVVFRLNFCVNAGTVFILYLVGNSRGAVGVYFIFLTSKKI
jgi:hypothetical protein